MGDEFKVLFSLALLITTGLLFILIFTMRKKQKTKWSG